MLAAMLFSVVNTLAGQPSGFWHHPETAIRGDGLSIHNPTNHAFEFFLGRGWAAYLMTSLVYFSVVSFLVSILSRRMALIAIFSVLFGHYFGTSLWLEVRWDSGLTGAFLYGVSLSAAVVVSVFPTLEVSSDTIVKRLRWVMVGVIFLDFANTLLGQPSSFWTRPETCQESDPFVHAILSRGWPAFCLLALVYTASVFRLVAVVSGKTGLIVGLALVLIHFLTASSWFFYRWRLGMEAPAVYGAVLSVIIVSMAFPRSLKRTGKPVCEAKSACAIGSAFC